MDCTAAIYNMSKLCGYKWSFDKVRLWSGKIAEGLTPTSQLHVVGSIAISDAVFLLHDHKWRWSPYPSGGRFGLCWLCSSLETKRCFCWCRWSQTGTCEVCSSSTWLAICLSHPLAWGALAVQSHVTQCTAELVTHSASPLCIHRSCAGHP